MKLFSSKAAREHWSTFDLDSTLFAFDFDGTLAPIVSTAKNAKMSTETLKLIKKLSHRYPVAIISGRSIQDLKTRLDFKPKYLVGNHGLEILGIPSLQSKRAQKISFSWKAKLDLWQKQSFLKEALQVEDKKYSLAVHYRKAKNPKLAEDEVRFILQTLKPKPRVVGGKRVFNLIPPNSPNKGTALLKLMKKKKFQFAFYIGDDDTDEDVFSLRNSKIFSVRVGKKRASQADYFIKNQQDINLVLRFFLKNDLK